MKVELVNVFYIDNTFGEPPTYEATTNNFEKWLEAHNKQRIDDGNEPETETDFKVESANLIVFDCKELS